jgi:ParB-like nuclease family protein
MPAKSKAGKRQRPGSRTAKHVAASSKASQLPAETRAALTLQRMPLKLLAASPHNPRLELKAGDVRFEALKRSIDTFGYVDPIIWNERTKRVVGGHQRLSVMRALGYTEADVVRVDMDGHQEAALNIALNKIEGDWDVQRLAGVLSGFEAWSIDPTLTGFSEAELTNLLGREFASGRTDANAEWSGMPDYSQGDQSAYRQIIVNFPDARAVKAFAALIEQQVTDKTRSLWFPPAAIEPHSREVYDTKAQT